MTDLLDVIDDYLRQAAYDSLEFWLYPFGVLLACWMVFLLIRFGRFRRKDEAVSDEYQIYSNLVVAASIVSFLLIGGCCYAWSTGFYNRSGFEFSHLLALLFSIGISIGAFYTWRSFFTQRKLQNIVNYGLTEEIQQRREWSAKQNFQRTKFWLLLPALGFLMLWLVQNRNYNLVSFVVDNSPTMGESIFGGDAPLEVGKDALSQTFEELDEYTDIIISTFQSGDYKSSASDIVMLGNSNQLLGVNAFYEGINKDDAIFYVENDLEVVGGQSPICETIWKNFLFAREQTDDKTYENTLLVIVTDGRENNVDVNQFLCEQPEFNEFYPPENVYLINLDNMGFNDFIQKAENCGYTVEDGTDMASYVGALEDIMRDFTSNWFFVIWLAIIYVVMTLIAFLVNPQRIK